MRGTRFIKTIAALVFAAILVTCIPFKLFADSLPRSVSLEASEGVTAEFAIENSWAGYFIDNQSGRTWLRVQTWGYEYYLDFDEFYSYSNDNAESFINRDGAIIVIG